MIKSKCLNLDEIEVFPSVYEPAEDSFLLARHAIKLKGRILEIGCGSGIVALSNAKQNPKNEVVGVDINSDAVNCASKNAKLNNIKNVKFMKSNLFSELSESMKFNVILFNPPYLPTTPQEKVIGKLNAAFDGGRDGRKVFDKFLSQFDKYLGSNGIVLLIQSSLNNLKKTEQILEKKGFKIEILESESFFFERLYLLKIVKATH